MLSRKPQADPGEAWVFGLVLKLQERKQAHRRGVERKGERLDFSFFYLATPGLGCGTRDLCLRHAGSNSLT